MATLCKFKLVWWKVLVKSVENDIIIIINEEQKAATNSLHRRGWREIYCWKFCLQFASSFFFLLMPKPNRNMFFSFVLFFVSYRRRCISILISSMKWCFWNLCSARHQKQMFQENYAISWNSSFWFRFIQLPICTLFAKETDLKLNLNFNLYFYFCFHLNNYMNLISKHFLQLFSSFLLLRCRYN